MKSILLGAIITITVAAQAQQRRLAIGDTAFCGIVFHVIDSGRMQRVLVCALKDEASRIRWNNGNYTTTFASSDGLFKKSNADKIIVRQGPVGQYAANICRFAPKSDTTTFFCRDSTRWYLPSKAELKLLYDNLGRTKKVKFAKEGYWSSVERASRDTIRRVERKAWIVDFLNGREILNDKANRYNVRPIKAENNFF